MTGNERTGMGRRAVLLSAAGVAALSAIPFLLGGRPAKSQPEVAPATPVLGGPALGINLTPISYYTPNVFLNRLKASSRWDTYGKPAPADEHGYPTSLGGERLIGAMVPCEPGRYVLLHDGDMDVRLQGGTIRSKANGRVTFEVAQPDAFRQLVIDAIRRPPKSMQLVRAEHEALLAAGETFTPEFLSQVKGFDTLRFMDWMRTNGSEFVDRYTQVEACSYERGVPIAVMAALAKRIGAQPWICIPHRASDQLVREMVGAIGNGIVEFSNEVWNLGFDQAKFARDQAATMWGANTPGTAWYGYRAAQIARIVRAAGSHMVLGSQTVVPERAEAVWNGVQKAGASGRDFFGWIIATYVAGTLTDARGATPTLLARNDVAGAIENLLHATNQGAMSVVTMAPIYAAHGRIAAAHGLELIAYEGNMHLNALPAFGPQLEPVRNFFAAVTRDPRAGQVMDANLNAFAAAGGRLACLYNLSSAPGPSGAFGLVDSGAWGAVQRRLAARR